MKIKIGQLTKEQVERINESEYMEYSKIAPKEGLSFILIQKGKFCIVKMEGGYRFARYIDSIMNYQRRDTAYLEIFMS